MEEATCFNFDVRFTKEDSGYRAEILESPGGSGQHTFAFPFHERDLENYLLKIGKRSSGMRSFISEADQQALEFGSKLFETVFSGELGAAFEKSLEVRRNTGARLRIRLHLEKTPELADLPWEYLYQSRRKRFLARSEFFPVVRYFDLPEKEKPLAVTPPLRVLVMLSNPSDVEALEVEEEYKRLKESVKELEAKNLLIVDRLATATLRDLQEQLQKHDYHIFHFVGHGHFDPASKQSFLVIEHDNRRMRFVSGVDIGTYLSDEPTLRLVVLNACEGGRASANDATSGVAQSLVVQGIPAVIAMQFEVSDRAAIELARGFYQSLANNYPVDAALSEARKAIIAADCGVEWGTPVLYLNATDGRIFNVATIKPQTAEKPPQAETEQILHQPVPMEREPLEVPQAPVAPEPERLLATTFRRPPKAGELDVIEAFNQHLRAGEKFHVWPKVPNHKLNGAKSSFLKLRQDELLLALCDTTVFKENAKNGFALTTKRIYWKNLADQPKSLAYQDLVGPIEMKKRNCDLGGGCSILEIPDVGDLPLFLQAAARACGRQVQEKEESLTRFARPPTPEDLKVIEALKRYLQSAEKFYIWPNIPNDQLTTAKNSFLELRDDELLLALGDTTYLAKDTKNGFALTTKRIYWKNTGFSSQKVDYVNIEGPIQVVGRNIEGRGRDFRGYCDLGHNIRISGLMPDKLALFLQAAASVFGTYVEAKDPLGNFWTTKYWVGTWRS
jgi:hypothetical protein